jgi:hypothetical protein
VVHGHLPLELLHLVHHLLAQVQPGHIVEARQRRVERAPSPRALDEDHLRVTGRAIPVLGSAMLSAMEWRAVIRSHSAQHSRR